jgi:hypothetical protein
MHKKHYERLAWLIGQYVLPLSLPEEAGMTADRRRVGCHLFLAEIVLWLMDDNPRFDSRKFCDAVIVSLKEIMGDFELDEEWMQEQENRQEFDTGTMTSDT